METKKWYKSKTVWVAIIAGVLGVSQALGFVIPEYVYAILGSLGLYSLRVGTTKIQ